MKINSIVIIMGVSYLISIIYLYLFTDKEGLKAIEVVFGDEIGKCPEAERNHRFGTMQALKFKKLHQ